MRYIDDRYVGFVKNSNQVSVTYGPNFDLNAHHYIMWSGGSDSTLLLYELLQIFGPEKVHAVSYKYPWLLSAKAEMEDRYRNLFKAKLGVIDPRLQNFSHAFISISTEKISGDKIHFKYGDKCGFIQSASWLLSIPQFTEDNSYVYMGDIVNDQLDSARQQSLYDTFSGICGLMGKELKLRRPYLLLDKTNILYKLIEYGIYDCVWFCEMPETSNNKICGSCKPCQLHLSSLNTLANIDPDVPDFVKLYAKREYDRLMEIRTSKPKYLKAEEVEVVDDVKDSN